MTSWGARVCSVLILAAAAGQVSAAPVAARFPEGIVHGFLVMRDAGGKQIAQGDLRQVRNENAAVTAHQ